MSKYYESKELKTKVCWLAKETKKGWRLFLCLGEKQTFKLLPKLYFRDIKSLKKALNASIVFVRAKGK